LPRDELDGLGDAGIGGDVGAAQVVQAPEDVVVPARRVGELRPFRADDLSRRAPAEHAPLEEVLLAATARFGDGGHGALRALVPEEALEDRDGRVKRRSLALRGLTVPATVFQLLAKQALTELVARLAEVGGGGEEASVDAGLDLALEEGRIAE